MKTFLYFNIFFALLFGPKFGLFDTSVFIPIFLYIVFLKQQWKIPKLYYELLLMLLLLMFYQGIIQIINDNIEFESIGRLVRAIITIIFVGLLFTSSLDSDKKKFLNILLYAIIFHAIIIIIAANISTVNEILSIISGNDRVRELRASGLLAGFDIAGYISIIGMSIIVFRASSILSLSVNSTFMVLLLLSCFFTSRVSSIIGVLLFFAFSIQVLRDSKIYLFYRIILGVLMSFLFYSVTYQIFLILEVTLSLGILEVDQSVVTNVLSRYAAQDLDDLTLLSMFILPGSDLQLIFGTGQDTLKSDIGYIKGIYRYGLVGVVFSIGIYFYFIYRSFNNKSSNLYQYIQLPLFLLITTLVLTIKNNYIFVRGVFPAFLIIISIMRYYFNSKINIKR